MKKCITCGVEKADDLSSFYRSKTGELDSRCKDCVKKAAKSSYERNREAKIAAASAWRKANPERYAAAMRKLLSKPGAAEKIAATKKKHEQLHSERRAKERRDRERKRWASDINYKLGKVISHQMRKALSSGKSGEAWEEMVGYSVDVLRVHLEAQLPKGMTWGNYGKDWHIDHIQPLSSFDLLGGREVVRECWSLTNLRPLGAIENRTKAAKRLFLL